MNPGIAISLGRRGYRVAVAVCALTTLVALPLARWLDQANVAMMFLLAVFLVAVRHGRGPAVLAAFLSVALLDFFFVPPHLSFSVADAQYLVTFGIMLAVGLIASHLTAQLAERREQAQIREHEARMLYQLARELGAALTFAQAAEVLERFFAPMRIDSALLVAESLDPAAGFASYGVAALDPTDLALARSAYDGNRSTKLRNVSCTPFAGVTRTRGVLATIARDVGSGPSRTLLEAVSSLVGIAVERIHYVEVAQQTEVEVQGEKLRSTLLSSISHDLRTPLTSLVGLADALAGSRPDGPTTERALMIRDQAHAMHSMVTNLLDMARLQSGRVVLNRQWQPFEDVVGSSLRLLADGLARRDLRIDVPADLPLVRFDAVLMERVLYNLIENAIKYSPADAQIRIAARVSGDMLEVAIGNSGSAFPADRLDQVFEIFTRGVQEPALPGTGIGLAVCKAIVVAHGGSIAAENAPGEARVRFTLPLGNPPAIDGEAS